MATEHQMQGPTLAERLVAHGFSRRDFLTYCGSLAVMLGLSATAAPRIAEALEASE